MTTKIELNWRRLTCKLLPRLVEDVIHERFTCHRVLAGIAGGAAEQDDFRLADDGNGVAKARLGDVAVDLKFFDNLVAVTRSLDLVL